MLDIEKRSIKRLTSCGLRLSEMVQADMNASADTVAYMETEVNNMGSGPEKAYLTSIISKAGDRSGM